MNRDKINQIIAELTANIGWEKAFNSLEDKLLTKSLDRLIEHIELKENELDKSSVDIFNLQSKVDDAFDLDLFELAKNINQWQDEYQRISEEYGKALSEIDKSLKSTFADLKSYQDEFDNEIKLYTNTSDNIDANILYARVMLSDKRLKGIAKTLKIANIEVQGEFNLLCDDLLTLSRFTMKKYERHNAKMEELRQQLKKQEKEKYKKLFHYKDLIKLAIQQGFEYLRSNGDHLIYRNKQSQNIAVIPAHTNMKYGTMLNVQKMIYA